jgi:hypothetical protein
MLDLFEWDGRELKVNVPEILLYKEFDRLWHSRDWGACKEDPKGENNVKATLFMRFLWLAYHPRSLYQELPTEEARIAVALDDVGFKPEDIEHGVCVNVIYKYKYFRSQIRILRFLDSANGLVDKLTDFFDTVDINERDNNNKLVHSSRNIMQQISEINETAAGLAELEKQVRAQMNVGKSLRGQDTEEGAFD